MLQRGRRCHLEQSQTVRQLSLILAFLCLAPRLCPAADEPRPLIVDTKQTEAYQRIKSALDRVRAIDTHDHLRPFREIPGRVKTDQGEGMTLHSIFGTGYYRWINPLSPWQEGESFDQWWERAQHDFDNARATSFYRYLMPAFTDLYGVDFDTITTDQARELNQKVFANYKDQKWLVDVIRNRANIALMFVDPYWSRLELFPHYEWTVPLLNVTTLVDGYHESQYNNPLDSPYAFAAKRKLPIGTLDEYLAVLDAIFREAKAGGAVCLKSTLAYVRTLHYEKVTKETAAGIFGKKRGELTQEQVKQFQDFIFWRLCELSAKHDLPFQIHTGQARIQGSNPMLLVDLIEANPNTKFILFHGGFPWVGETGVIVMKYPRHVWIDSVWLPTLSYTMAKRAFHEWLEVMPSNRIMWGADDATAEAIYGATEMTRRCIAEVLAEKVAAGDLHEQQALRVGRQILRDNALELFTQLKPRAGAAEKP